jgi:hypothetical protein
MALPTYEEIASRLETETCNGTLSGGVRCFSGDHQQGLATATLIHWSDRKSTRGGIKRFLLLEAERRYPLFDEPTWARLWTHLRAVWTMAAEIGVRFPPRLKLFEKDKAHLRAMLVKVPTDTPGRAEAMAWATRR